MSSSPSAARILLVDDDRVLTRGLATWLERAGYDVQVADDVYQALARVRDRTPEIVVTDIRLPGLTGRDLVTAVREYDPTISVIILSAYPSFEDAVATLRHGRAFDFLCKPLREVRELAMVIEKALMQRLQRGQVRPAPSAADPASGAIVPTAPLGERETDILRLLCMGLENREIADRLCLSEKTVRNYLTGIYQKLGVPNRTQAAMTWARLSESLDLL
jgi:DNA-binding NarL/FixJ family response regulator